MFASLRARSGDAHAGRSGATPPRPYPAVEVLDTPRVEYRKLLSFARGPPGWVLVLGTLGMMTYGIYRMGQSNIERRYEKLAQFARRYEECVVLQARENARYRARREELYRDEMELMKDVPGWVPGQNVFLTQRPPRPQENVLDRRPLWDR